MRIFVTGATGFVGSAVVRELMSAAHDVIGLARSDHSAATLTAAGAEALRGDVTDLASLARGVETADAVIHTAFNHDFSKFAENCEHDRRAIEAMGQALAGSNRPIIITSGIGLLRADRPVAETDSYPRDAQTPRIATEQAAEALLDRGVNCSILRLPPSVHGTGDHGFVPVLIGIARARGVSAYMGEGDNRWPAVHRNDAATLYRLAIERGEAGARYHAAAEAGIDFRGIAGAIGRGLDLPVVSKPVEVAAEHFGWFYHFAAMDCQASSAITREKTGWMPKEPGLIADMEAGHYFQG